MKRKIQKQAKRFLLLLFAGSIVMSGYYTVQSRNSQKSYEQVAARVMQENSSEEYAEQEAETMAQETSVSPKDVETEAETQEELVEVRYWREIPVQDDPYMETLAKVNLESLREVNQDVLGWIVIPDTQLDYPLMRGEDNEYYLKRNWEGKSNAAGSIFMECVNNKDFKHFNTVIYGHRMKNGSMFGSLKNYFSKIYWEKHPYVYIYDDAGAHRYEIFAAYEATLEGSTYQVGFADDESKQEFLDNCISYSVIDTGVVPTIEDRIITLSTCVGIASDSRWVVQARRMGEIIVQMEPKKGE